MRYLLPRIHDLLLDVGRRLWLSLQLGFDQKHLVVGATQRVEKFQLGLWSGRFRLQRSRLGALFSLTFVREKSFDIEEGATAEVGVGVEMVSRTETDFAERIFNQNLESQDQFPKLLYYYTGEALVIIKKNIENICSTA